jgi:hypothetical protein
VWTKEIGPKAYASSSVHTKQYQPGGIQWIWSTSGMATFEYKFWPVNKGLTITEPKKMPVRVKAIGTIDGYTAETGYATGVIAFYMNLVAASGARTGLIGETIDRSSGLDDYHYGAFYMYTRSALS